MFTLPFFAGVLVGYFLPRLARFLIRNGPPSLPGRW
jgi:hypothetical protein